MLLSVILYSLSPIFFHIGNADIAPLGFNATRMFFECVILFSCIAFLYYKKINIIEILIIKKAITTNWCKYLLIGIFIGAFDLAILAWSLKYINLAAATVLYQTWPIWMILFTSKMFIKNNRYEKVGLHGWFYIIIGFIGLSIVILSQIKLEISNKEINFEFNKSVFAGSLLAVMAAIISALHVSCSIKWGNEKMNSLLSGNKNMNIDSIKKYMEMFFVMTGILIASIPVVIVSCLFLFSIDIDEEIHISNMAMAAIQGSFFAGGIAMIIYRMANIITPRLEINILSYAIPLISILWIGVFGYIEVIKLNWLIIGACGIVAANILIYFKK